MYFRAKTLNREDGFLSKHPNKTQILKWIRQQFSWSRPVKGEGGRGDVFFKYMWEREVADEHESLCISPSSMRDCGYVFNLWTQNSTCKSLTYKYTFSWFSVSRAFFFSLFCGTYKPPKLLPSCPLSFLPLLAPPPPLPFLPPRSQFPSSPSALVLCPSVAVCQSPRRSVYTLSRRDLWQ